MRLSTPVRLLSLAIVALMVIVGVRGIVGGLAFEGDLLGTTGGSDAAGERTAGVVDYVLDGDTVQVTTRAGRNVRVRLLGISAPEEPKRGKPGECHHDSSTQHLEQLLLVGIAVTLVGDPSQDDVDSYGRWLRYVQANARDVGAAQIRMGAAAARASVAPVARHSTYRELEDMARDQGAGMWSACR